MIHCLVAISNFQNTVIIENAYYFCLLFHMRADDTGQNLI